MAHDVMRSVPPSGEQFPIEAGGYRAVVSESGAALRRLTLDGRPLVDGFGEGEMAGGGRGQLLMPWPNRIRDGRFEFAGASHQLALTEPARSNASHGLARWAAWSPLEHGPDRVSLGLRIMAQKGYPWTLDLRVTYAVDAGGLTVTQAATNRAADPAPYASGAHPYLAAGNGPVDGWRVTCPAATRLLTDSDRLLPTGREDVTGTDHDFRKGPPLGALELDDAFTDLTRDPSGVATTTLTTPEGSGVAIWVDEHHRWLQLFTEPRTRGSLAVEPMTAPPDAFNSGDDLVVLQPGDSFRARWGVRDR